MPTAAPNTELARPAPSAQMMSGYKGFGISTENTDLGLMAYTEDQQEILRFWSDLAHDRQWKLSEFAKNCGLSTTTLSRIYRGVYGAEITSAISILNRAKDGLADAVGNPDFIMTALARRMFTVFDKTRALQTVTIMWGPKGIGKSTVELEYVRQHNHGRTIYFRCPGHGCTTYQFVQALAKSMRIAMRGSNTASMRERIGVYLARGNRLLIVDELHEIFLTCSPREVIRICEWLRELYDTAQCGLVLTGTDVLHREFFKGVHSDVLGQLVDRGTVQIELPGKPTQKDVTTFLGHYGLHLPEAGTDAHRVLNDIIAAHGLRKLTLHLRDGKAYALKCQETYTWAHFSAAFTAIQSLSSSRR